MIRKKLFFTASIFLLLLGMLNMQSFQVSASETNAQPIDDPMKPWTISFNKEVSNQPQNLQSVYIQTSNKERQEASIQLSADSKKVIVETKKSYLFGEVYTLVIPKAFTSANGTTLKSDVTKSFQVTGKSITEITAIANPLFTNIIVKGTADISKVTFAVDGSEEQSLHRNSQHFSYGQQGLVKGDLLTVRAYDTQSNLIETQYYKVK